MVSREYVSFFALFQDVFGCCFVSPLTFSFWRVSNITKEADQREKQSGAIFTWALAGCTWTCGRRQMVIVLRQESLVNNLLKNTFAW